MKSPRGEESELKYGLQRKEFVRLLRAHQGRVLRSERHQNFYFDDIHLNLRHKRIGLRIRVMGRRKAVVTLKYPKGTATALRALKVRREFEATVNYPTAVKIIRGQKDILTLRQLPIQKLKRIYPVHQLCQLRPLGSVETERTVVPLNKKMEMELDRSRVFGKFFYEVEVETQRPLKADRLIRNLFWKYGIGYHPVRRSKLARFIEEWRERRE